VLCQSPVRNLGREQAQEPSFQLDHLRRPLRWEIGQALANAAFKDPDCLRGFASVAMVLSRAADVTARPGLLDKAIALGADWRQEPVPAPSRAELLSIVAGD